MKIRRTKHSSELQAEASVSARAPLLRVRCILFCCACSTGSWFLAGGRLALYAALTPDIAWWCLLRFLGVLNKQYSMMTTWTCHRLGHLFLMQTRLKRLIHVTPQICKPQFSTCVNHHARLSLSCKSSQKCQTCSKSQPPLRSGSAEHASWAICPPETAAWTDRFHAAMLLESTRVHYQQTPAFKRARAILNDCCKDSPACNNSSFDPQFRTQPESKTMLFPNASSIITNLCNFQIDHEPQWSRLENCKNRIKGTRASSHLLQCTLLKYQKLQWFHLHWQTAHENLLYRKNMFICNTFFMIHWIISKTHSIRNDFV